jgi:hypothetical protein
MSNVDGWRQNEWQKKRENTRKQEDKTGMGHSCPEMHANEIGKEWAAVASREWNE